MGKFTAKQASSCQSDRRIEGGRVELPKLESTGTMKLTLLALAAAIGLALAAPSIALAYGSGPQPNAGKVATKRHAVGGVIDDSVSRRPKRY